MKCMKSESAIVFPSYYSFDLLTLCYMFHLPWSWWQLMHGWCYQCCCCHQLAKANVFDMLRFHQHWHLHWSWWQLVHGWCYQCCCCHQQAKAKILGHVRCYVSTGHINRSKHLFYFSFQPVLHDWCNKGRGVCYPVCGMVHIKEPLLLIGKSSLCGGSGFPFSLSEWFLTICLAPYNRK